MDNHSKKIMREYLEYVEDFLNNGDPKDTKELMEVTLDVLDEFYQFCSDYENGAYRINSYRMKIGALQDLIKHNHTADVSINDLRHMLESDKLKYNKKLPKY